MKPLSRLLAASCIGLLCDGLSHPSSQANDACKCNGWKNPNPPTAPRMDLQQPVTNLSEPCRSCSHALGNPPTHPGLHYCWDPRGGERCPPPVSPCAVSATADHVSHLENVSEEEINRLPGMVVDVENLFMSVHKEEDTDTKQVYFYLFKVRPSVLLLTLCPTCRQLRSVQPRFRAAELLCPISREGRCPGNEWALSGDGVPWGLCSSSGSASCR